MSQQSSTRGRFLERLRGLGIVLHADGDQLRCSAPRNVLTPELRAEMRRRKPELLAELRQAAADRLIVRTVPREGPLPLAVPQERIWFLHQMAPTSSAYTIVASMRLVGTLSHEAFLHAWRTIVARHETLRTCYPVIDGVPYQRVQPHVDVELNTVDLRSIPVHEREARAVELATQEAERPFDLERGPVFRLALLRLGDDEYVNVTAIHHIACDQWSLGVIADEFAEVYTAFLDGRVPRLRELPFQYADFAVCHREWTDAPHVSGQMAYWKRQLAGLAKQDLPTDRPRTSLNNSAGARGRLQLSPELLRRIRQTAASERATPFMLLIAAFKVVLSRYTGQKDVAVGTPIANRTVRDVERLVGTFVNTLVFRTSVSDDVTFRALLASVRETALDAFANQDLVFDRLVAELQPERDLNRPPLFLTLFNVQNAPVKMLGLPGIEAAPFPLPRRWTQFDLTISIDTEILGQIHYSYSTALFDPQTVDRIFRHYQNVLEAVVRDPDQRVSAIELMTPGERATLLEDWNDTGREFPREETVVHLVEEQVRRRPGTVAVRCGGTELTYRELNARAERIAGYLQHLGVGPESLVGICLNRSVDLLAALLGVLKAGAAYLPLDPAFPQSRLTFMIEDSGASFVVTETALLAMLPAEVRAIVLDADRAAIDSAPPRTSGATASADNLAYVLYTSGSTGMPKGVAIDHRALTNFLMSMQASPGLSADDRLLAVTTLSFDIAGLELYLPLTTGARVVMAAKDDAIDPARLAGMIEAEGITLMQATPATWRMLIDHGWAGNEGLTILCGGEALPRDLADRLLDRARHVWNMYGPTETTIWSAVEHVVPGAEPVSIGRPIANTQVYVLDAALRPTPIGVPGELFIGGDGVARGYLGRPDLTASRFVPDLFSGRSGARLYRTGDLARYRTDGRLECLGRTDHQVKVRGFRIELGEIEAALTAHESVSHAAVVAHPDATGEARLVAYVVAAAGTAATDVLREHLRDRLPPYMIPSVFVELPALPLTPNGKVDRARLPAPVMAPRAGGGGGPSSPVEQKLVEIWRDVLGVPSVDVDDDFFDLGGHSLLAVRLMARIETELGRTLALATLFEARTVRQIADVIEERTKLARWSCLVPIQPEGPRPPFFCVHGVGGEVLSYLALASHMAPDQPFVAIRAAGYDGQSEPVHTIEDQAALYIREMLAYQPVGPYYIGGYSHGGRVALEMALQLERMDHEVAFIGILDTTPFEVRYNSLKYWGRMLRNVPLWFWYDAMRTPWRENRDRLSRAWRLVRRVAAARRHGPHSGEPAMKPDLSDSMNLTKLPDRIRRMYVMDYDAFLAYRPNGQCERVTVFRSRGQPLFASHEPDLNWRRVTKGEVRVRHVPGNHSSILAEPDVRVLANELRAALAEAQHDVTPAVTPTRVPAA